MIITEIEREKIKNLFKQQAVVAFPTDTVWGMGCLPESESAVKRIYSTKKRSEQKPLILISNELKNLKPYIIGLNEIEKSLIEKYFPGALTLVVNKSEKTPDYMTSGLDTVGIRVPDNPVLSEFFEYCVPGKVLATTSANISGVGATAQKSVVEKSVGLDVDYILDDYGYKPKGIESTVVLVDNGNIKVLRQGSIKINL